MVSKRCELCGKKLVPIGCLRKNGKKHLDWEGRQYHKKCWYKMMEFRLVEMKCKSYTKEMGGKKI
jgi:hypothetical protein